MDSWLLSSLLLLFNFVLSAGVRKLTVSCSRRKLDFLTSKHLSQIPQIVGGLHNRHLVHTGHGRCPAGEMLGRRNRLLVIIIIIIFIIVISLLATRSFRPLSVLFEIFGLFPVFSVIASIRSELSRHRSAAAAPSNGEALCSSVLLCVCVCVCVGCVCVSMSTYPVAV